MTHAYRQPVPRMTPSRHLHPSTSSTGAEVCRHGLTWGQTPFIRPAITSSVAWTDIETPWPTHTPTPLSKPRSLQPCKATTQTTLGPTPGISATPLIKSSIGRVDQPFPHSAAAEGKPADPLIRGRRTPSQVLGRPHLWSPQQIRPGRGAGHAPIHPQSRLSTVRQGNRAYRRRLGPSPGHLPQAVTAQAFWVSRDTLRPHPSRITRERRAAMLDFAPHWTGSPTRSSSGTCAD